MTEKERKHQYYLAHRDEYLARSQKWSEAHRSEKIAAVRRSEAKRKAAMTPEELAAYLHMLSVKSGERYRKRLATETPEQREERLARNRAKDLARRRAQGIKPKPPRMSDEERLARKREWYYKHKDDDDERRQYERDRKRAYRARKRAESISPSDSSEAHC